MSKDAAEELAKVLEHAGIADPAIRFGKKMRDPDLWVDLADNHPPLRIRGYLRTNVHYRQLLREQCVWAAYENEIPVLVTKPESGDEDWIAHIPFDDFAALINLVRGD